MNIVTISTLIGFFILLGIGAVIYYKRNKQKKKLEEQIPQEVLDIFEECERRYKESNGYCGKEDRSSSN
jgi:LPXTG-motif cell wall-anchored protein